MVNYKNNEAGNISPSGGNRFVGIEGLRGLAAVTVLIGHVGIHMAKEVEHPGPVEPLLNMMGQGLTLFFALSGFLLFRPFASGILDSGRRPSVRKYFTNRALRIYPAYLVILVFVCLIIGKGYTAGVQEGAGVEGAGETVGYVTDPLVLFTNALMIHTLFPETIKTGLGVSWTLTVELVFYLILPMLAYLAYRFTGSRQKLAPTFALLPVAVVLGLGIVGKYAVSVVSNPSSPEESFFLNWGANWTAVLARSFPAHADLFAFGMLAALVYVLLENDKIKTNFIPAVRWGGLGVGLAAIIVTDGTPLTDTGFAMAGAALILFVVLPDTQNGPGVLASTLDLKPIRYVGMVSYSLYLWHIPVIWILIDLGVSLPATPLGFWGNVLIAFTASMVLATVTYELVEKQAMKLKNKADRKRIEVIAAS